MIDRKPRLLMINEFTWMKTGFSKIGLELFKILHDRGNLELAEMASYVVPQDPGHAAMMAQSPWKVYPVSPGGQVPGGDELLEKRTNSSNHHRCYNQFGSAAFEQVAIDFRADVIFSIRDYWMDPAWHDYSAFYFRPGGALRPYKNYYMPTIDGIPQRIPWLDSMRQADKIFTYTNWAKGVLAEEAPGLEVSAVLRPGVDPAVFRPLDKIETRRKLGLPDDADIVLTVMRNQKRKLFPDLIESFDDYLKLLVSRGEIDRARKSYLYLHTSFQDVGFDIQSFAMKHGLGHKILTTYICRGCGTWFPSIIQTELCPCPRCNRMAAFTTNTGFGIDDPSLNEIYNIADMYVQFAISEGLSCPCVEARSAGLAIFATDYSAISDQSHEPGGFPIEVERYFWEAVIETEQARAYPSKKDLVKKMDWWLSQSPAHRQTIGLQGRAHVEKHYSYRRAADILEQTILADNLPDQSQTWLDPVGHFCPLSPNPPHPQSVSIADFVDWCIDHVLGQPQRKATIWRDELIKAVSYGQRMIEGSRQYQVFGHKECFEFFVAMAQEHNFFESMRLQRYGPRLRSPQTLEITHV